MAEQNAADSSTKSSGGSFKMPAWVRWILIAIVIYVVLRVGVTNLLNLLDPGGTGGLLDRAPRATWHVGAVAIFVGIMVAIWRGWKDHGHHLMGYGFLALLIGLLGPSTLAWAPANLPHAWTGVLNSLSHIDLSGIRVK